MSATLSPQIRASLVDELDGLAVDVLVIGGGITGAGAALDAAQRGLSVLLIEAVDLAAGTSSKSTKLIHGGLRYLEQLDFPLVREALAERGRMTSVLCPHLVRPLPFLFPLAKGVLERGYIGAGIALYDGLAVVGGARLPRHAHLGRKAAIERFPDLRPDVLTGAIQYWDAQVDDARHTLMVARTAAAEGARILTGARVIDLVRSADGGGVEGAVIALADSDGARATIRSRVVINATGPWCAETERLLGRSSLSVAASKGVHLVVPGDRITGDVALITKTETSVLFVIPFGHNWLIGTTDTPYQGDLDHPCADSSDVAYLLAEANRWLTSDLTRDDIIGVFSGLRPLIAEHLSGHSRSDQGSVDAATTTKLSREHLTTRPVPGFVSIAGGKYTTYRVMAADAVDAAAEDLGRGIRASHTHDLPLFGADGYHEALTSASTWGRRLGVSDQQVDRLLGRYGGAITELAAIIDDRPEAAQPLVGAAPYLEVEVLVAARSEGARSLDDVLRRRTRIAFDSPDRGRGAASRVAELLAPELGWTDARRQAEVEAWTLAVCAELTAEGLDPPR